MMMKLSSLNNFIIVSIKRDTILDFVQLAESIPSFEQYFFTWLTYKVSTTNILLHEASFQQQVMSFQMKYYFHLTFFAKIQFVMPYHTWLHIVDVYWPTYLHVTKVLLSTWLTHQGSLVKYLIIQPTQVSKPLPTKPPTQVTRPGRLVQGSFMPLLEKQRHWDNEAPQN